MTFMGMFTVKGNGNLGLMAYLIIFACEVKLDSLNILYMKNLKLRAF